MAEARHLLVVYHSRSGSTASLLADIRAGIGEAAAAIDEAGEVAPIDRVLAAPDAGAADVQWADALILATPANFGYMSGLVKDFFERAYPECLDTTVSLPFALVVKGDTDADGAVASVERIATGLQWKEVLPPLVVVGQLTDAHRAAARELGATVAAGLAAGIF
jgi:multimeric flavodoxin WrbA